MLRHFASRITEDMRHHYRALGVWSDQTVDDLLWSHAEAHSDLVAMSDSRGDITFSQLLERMREVKELLDQLSAGKGAVVALRCPNVAEFVVIHGAVTSTGAVLLTIPPGVSDRELTGILRRSDSDVVFMSEQEWQRRSAAVPGRLSVFTFEDRGERDSIATLQSRRVVDSLFRAHEGKTHGADDEYLMMPTAGTTGLPKLALRTHNSWLAMARKKLATLGEASFKGSDDSTLVLSPIAQGLGYLHGFVIPLLVPGMRRLLFQRFDPVEVLRVIETKRPSVVVCVPAQAIRLMPVLQSSSHDLSSLRMVQVGGDHFPGDLRREFEDLIGAPVISDYGLSDVGAACAVKPSDPVEKRLGTVGRPMPWTEVEVVDIGGRPLPAGEVGEVAINGPDLISCYYPNDTQPDSRGQLFGSGDLGRFDDDGYLEVVGRVKDLIIRGGQNISPAMVQKALRAYGRFRDVAVVGQPDRDLGERVAAFVVADQSSVTSLEELQSFLYHYGLNKPAWPEYLYVVDELPLSPGGKVQKAILRDWIANGTVRPTANREERTG